MTITADLNLHPAFKDTIPLPVAALHYRALGLGPGEFLYLLHLLHAQITGALPINRTRIASMMGVNRDTLSRYNRQLEAAGILIRLEQYEAGSQIENHYDLNRWLSLALDAYATNMDPLADLLDELATIDDIAQLRQLLENRTPLDRRIKGGVDPTIKGGVDPTIKGGATPPTSGTDHRTPLDRRIKGSMIDDQWINDQGSPKDHQSSMITPNPINALLALRARNGSRMDRQAASIVAGKASAHFGDDTAAVILRWCQYAEMNTAVINPPGFVRYKLESGEWPPEETPPQTNDNYLDRLPPDIRGVIQH